MPSANQDDRSDAAEPTWREVLRSLDLRPSRSRGQNFLHDHKIVRRIVDEAEIDDLSSVVEVGPGLGILTRELVSRSAAIVAIEVDPKLARYLQEQYGDGATIVQDDVLTADLTAILPHQPYMVVANLPYSIATAVIQRMFESTTPPAKMVVMVQLEVARRMIARPPDMSILAVAVQFYGNPKILFRVGRGAFIPVPNVDSAVVGIDVHKQPRLPRAQHPGFFRLVRAGFAQRRKRIENSIASALDLEKGLVAGGLAAAGLDPARRAETLDIDDWLNLYSAMRDVTDLG